MATTTFTLSSDGRRKGKSQRTTESILVAAEEPFSEHGFDGASLDAIDRRAGMQGTAILYHYATKRELYEAIKGCLEGDGSYESGAELAGRLGISHDGVRSAVFKLRR